MGMTLRDMLEWAAERGFRKGYEVGYDAGVEIEALRNRHYNRLNNGARDIRAEGTIIGPAHALDTEIPNMPAPTPNPLDGIGTT